MFGNSKTRDNDITLRQFWTLYTRVRVSAEN